jgi:hypothetical protein
MGLVGPPRTITHPQHPMRARENSDAKGLAGRSATVGWFDNAACVTDLGK